MTKSSRQLDLTLESIRYEIQLRPQHLDRHKALVPQVARPIDGRHAAVAAFGFDRVAVT